MHNTLSAASRSGLRVFIELVATQKTLIDKNRLAQFAPDATYYLSQKSLYVLRNWLSIRYNRAAYPDQFVNRMRDTKLDEKLANRIRKYPDISTIFFDLDRGVERDHSDGSPYELSVILAFVPGDEPDSTIAQVSSAEDEIKQLFVDRVPVGHFKLPHLWPVKLPQAGWVNYQSTVPSRARRAVASLSR